MSELGELLELLHTSRTRFRSLHAHFTLWERVDIKMRALTAHMERRAAKSSRVAGRRSGHFSGSFFGPPPADLTSEPEEAEGSVELWVRPGGFREEVNRESDPQLLVRNGDDWWEWSPDLGVSTNTDDAEPWTSTVRGEYEQLVDPAELLAHLNFEPLGQTERAGRRARRARAVPRSEVERTAAALFAIGGPGADEYTLEVDAECGVILFGEARLGDVVFARVEAQAVAVDPELGPDTFTFVAPDG